jgi:hypothetical protein
MITGMPRIAIAVRDFDKAVSTFRDGFGMPVEDLSATTVKTLGAKLAMCSPGLGSNIELMSPANLDAPLSQSLVKFLDRKGEGLFALMLEAVDPDAEAELILQRGLNVLPLMVGAGGRDIHPRSTHGVLIRIYPVNSYPAPPAEYDDASLKLSGIVRVVIAVNDLENAVAVYGEKFAMDISHVVEDSERGISSVICRPPSGGEIEIVAARSPNSPYAKSIQDFLASGKEGLQALVLQAEDLNIVKEKLAIRGINCRFSADSPAVLEVDKTATFGAQVRIEAM